MLDEQLNQSKDMRDTKKYVFHRTMFRRFLVGVLRKLLKLVLKVEVQGLENIPKDGALILGCNHLTNYDVFPMQMVIRRPLFFMAKSELHKNPIMDIVLRNLGAFPVYRGQRDQWAIRHAQKVLEHGQVLALFPEGTRSRGRGLKVGKSGAARLAIQLGCPIIPVAINGTEKMFTGFPKRTPIRLVIGSPIYPERGETTLGLTDRLMFTIAAMLPPELRGVYAQIPVGFEL
jgi:1-acyl-sn-glycerol-3-phosphate acyltransferase